MNTFFLRKTSRQISLRRLPAFASFVTFAALSLGFSNFAFASDWEPLLKPAEDEPVLELSLSIESVGILGDEDNEFTNQREQVISSELEYTQPFFLGELISGQTMLLATAEQIDASTETTVNGSYVTLEELWFSWAQDSKTLWLGRRNIEDSSSWWWGEPVTGAGFSFHGTQISSQLLAAISQASVSSQSTTGDPEDESIFMLLGSMKFQPTLNRALTIYLFHHEDTSSDYKIDQMVGDTEFDESDNQLTWFGLRYERSFAKTLPGEWALLLDAAWLTGQTIEYELKENEDEQAVVTEKTRTSRAAWAFNTWLSWQPPEQTQLELRLGYAFGSGTKNNHTEGSRTFEQTGLQANEDLTHYYGRISNPNLSNLHVGSVLINYQLQEESHIYTQFNRYRRASVYDDTVEFDIELDIQAASRDLGHEIAFGVNHEFGSGLQTELSVARYYPGDATTPLHSKPLDHFEITFSYEF